MKRTLASLVLLASIHPVRAAARQDAPLPEEARSAPAAASPLPSGERWAWNGTRGNIGRPPRWTASVEFAGSQRSERRLDPLEHARGLLAELCEVVLLDATPTPAQEVEGRFTQLWIRAADVQPYDGQEEVLVNLALARARALARRGQPEAALAATRELFLPRSIAAAAGDHGVVPAPAAALALEARAAEDARLVALRDVLAREASEQSSQAASGADDIERTVRRALEMDERRWITDLGARAQPALETLVLEDPGALPALPERDPLVLLMQIGELRSAAFVLAQRDVGGAAFKRRVLRAMGETGVLEDERAWDRSVYPARLAVPDWAAVVDWLAAEPGLERACLPAMVALCRRAPPSRAVQQALLRLATSNDPDTVRVLEGLFPRSLDPRAFVIVGECLRDGVADEGYVPLAVLQALLDGRDEFLKRKAARLLSDQAQEPALMAHLEDPDGEVRLAAVRSLVKEEDSDRGLVLGEALGDALRRCLRDPQAEIRALAVDGLRSATELDAPHELLLELARDENVFVRANLIGMRRGGQVDREVLCVLAADRHPYVLERVDAWLREQRHAVVGRGPGPEPFAATLLAAFLVRIDNPARPLSQWELLDSLMCVPEVLEALCARAESSAGAALAPRLLEALAKNAYRDYLMRSWLAVPAGTFERLARLQSGNPEWNEALAKALAEMTEWSELPRADLRAIFADPQFAADVRLAAGSLCAAAFDEDFPRTLIDALAAPGCGELAIPQKLDPVAAWVRNLPSNAARCACVEALLRHPEIPCASAARLLEGLLRASLAPRERAAQLLSEALERGDRREVVLWALRSLPVDAQTPRTDLLERALARGGCDQAVLDLVEENHLPEHATFLDAYLGLRGGQASADTQLRVVETLTTYATEEAARVLLKQATPDADPNVRAACLAGAAKILGELDQRVQIEARLRTGAARGEMLSKLDELARSPDPVLRAAAARGIGRARAPGAVERLARLLADPDAGVRAAAQAAIDEILASKETP